MFLSDHPARGLYTLRLVSKKSAGMDQFLQFRCIDIGEVPRCLAPFEQGRSDPVDHLIGTLGRKNGRNEKLKRILMIQRALRIRISGLKPCIDLSGAEVFSPLLSWTLTGCFFRLFLFRLLFWRRLLSRSY